MNQEKRNMTTDTAAQPWLSVIIPIYNAEKYLPKCLETIRKQTFRDFEVLMIDDGSTDRSAEICREYAGRDSRFHHLRKENGGCYHSRIFGYKHAAGTYVTACDADDLYTSDRVFARMHEVITESNCSALQFGLVKKYNHLGRNVRPVSVPTKFEREDFLAKEYPRLLCSFWNEAHLTTNACDKVYHRDLVAALPDPDEVERIFWGEDLIINMCLLENCQSFLFIPDILYCYQQLTGGTKRFSATTMRDLDRIKAYQLTYLGRYQGKSVPTMLRTLHRETAGWFFAYIQEALDHLNEAELTALIEETLRYPRFVQARNYFLEHNDGGWLPGELMRMADAAEYIRKAKERHGKHTVKDRILKILKRIYAAI